MNLVRPAASRAVGYLPWLVAYIALMVAIGAVLAYARRQVIAQLDTPEARAQWQAWKAETEKQAQSAGPVARRKVHSDEPPALVLLRDHFATIAAMSLTVASCFFIFLMIVVRGTKKTP
jgi:hypothetical protein